MKFGIQKIELNEVDSTNSFLKEYAKNNLVPEGFLVVAHTQLKGRGQVDGSWESKPGENLTCSYFIKPKWLSVNQSYYLYVAVSLAVERVLGQFLTDEVKIKWPNDIYINGCKITGILIENQIQNSSISQSVIGIGLNVNQKEFSKGIKATSLKILNQEVSNNQVLFSLNKALDHYFLKLKNSEFQEIVSEYLEKLYQKGEWKSYEYLGEELNLKILGISNSGLLMLENKQGEIKLADLKEIKFL